MRKFAKEKAGQLYGMQKIRGFCHLYIGQEACAAGSVSALQKGESINSLSRPRASFGAGGQVLMRLWPTVWQ